MLYDMVSDSVEKVGFPQPHAPVDKEGIVILCRRVGNSQTGRLGKLVAGSHDKIIERVFGVEERQGEDAVRDWAKVEGARPFRSPFRV